MYKHFLSSVIIIALILINPVMVQAGPVTTVEKISHYYIHGKTKRDLIKQMETLGPPYPHDGREIQSWGWTHRKRYPNSGCSKITVINFIKLPNWVNREEASLWMSWNWKRMLRALTRHERVHARINIRAGRELLVAKCERKAKKAIKIKRRKRNEKFDKYTDHGGRTGVFLF